MNFQSLFLHSQTLFQLIRISLATLFLICSGLTLAENEPNKDTPAGKNSPNKGEVSPQDEAGSTENTPSEKQQNTPETTQRVLINGYKKMSQRQREVISYLKLYGREKEAIELNAQDKPFYGFFLQERSGQPQGAVLILHDIEQHGHWPELVAPLREGLPDNGWITFSIELPHRPSPKSAYKEMTENTAKADKTKPEDKITNTEDKSEKKQAQPEQQKAEANSNNEPPQTSDTQEDKTEISDNEPELPKLDSLPTLKTKESKTTETSNKKDDPMQAYRDEVRAKINSALEYLRSRGQFNLVIIGSGEAALWAADTASNLDKEEGLALVIINSKTSPAQDEALIQKIASLELPILDLITHTNQSNYNQRILTVRKGEMRHRNKEGYSQIILPQNVRYSDAFTSQPDTDPAVRRIRGWLRSKAAGTALKVPRSQAQSNSQTKNEQTQ